MDRFLVAAILALFVTSSASAQEIKTPFFFGMRDSLNRVIVVVVPPAAVDSVTQAAPPNVRRILSQHRYIAARIAAVTGQNLELWLIVINNDPQSVKATPVDRTRFRLAIVRSGWSLEEVPLDQSDFGDLAPLFPKQAWVQPGSALYCVAAFPDFGLKAGDQVVGLTITQRYELEQPDH